LCAPKQVGKYHQHFDELLQLDQTGMAFLRSEYHLSDQEARKALGMFGLDGARHLVKMGELR
jgi:ATPase subunit of ABC transporter with duplicated ATPase domains